MVFRIMVPDQKISLRDVIPLGKHDDISLGWPLGRVPELSPGKHGTICLLRVSLARLQQLRSNQRLDGMEFSDAQPMESQLYHFVLPDDETELNINNQCTSSSENS